MDSKGALILAHGLVTRALTLLYPCIHVQYPLAHGVSTHRGLLGKCLHASILGKYFHPPILGTILGYFNRLIRRTNGNDESNSRGSFHDRCAAENASYTLGSR